MSLPLFYWDGEPGETTVLLPEETSRHMIQVLRMQHGEPLMLTNGRGKLIKAIIIDAHKKRTAVQVQEIKEIPRPEKRICMAVSPLKNASRYEWFLEKATEIGVQEFIPLICKRTEKEKLRTDRLQQILISAMLQSQQSWLPVLHQPQTLKEVMKRETDTQKLVAHCEPGNKTELASLQLNKSDTILMLVGPEGDFTIEEITMALENNFKPVALGPHRLRTETAAVAAAVLLCQL